MKERVLTQKVSLKAYTVLEKTADLTFVQQIKPHERSALKKQKSH